MNTEGEQIKYILDKLQYCVDNELAFSTSTIQTKILWNYITDLELQNDYLSYRENL